MQTQASLIALRELAEGSGAPEQELASKGFLQVANEVLQKQCASLTASLDDLDTKLRTESEEGLPFDVRGLCHQAQELIKGGARSPKQVSGNELASKGTLMVQSEALLERRQQLLDVLERLGDGVRARGVETLSFELRAACERADKVVEEVSSTIPSVGQARAPLRP